MLSLADVQGRLRAAIVTGTETGIEPFLLGGPDPLWRLAVHRRHYETSLAKVLVGRFPALEWLVGTPFLREAARSFIHARPPSAPCLAEYGEDFPAWIVERGRAAGMPWLAAVAELEWHLGIAALAVDRPPLAMSMLGVVAASDLPDTRLGLQPGLAYLRAAWPADELMQMFLDGSAPQEYVIKPTDLFLEVRGARGVFSMKRFDAGEFLFRERIHAGAAIGDAMKRASAHPDFDPRNGLTALFAEGLVTSATSPTKKALTHHDPRD